MPLQSCAPADSMGNRDPLWGNAAALRLLGFTDEQQPTAVCIGTHPCGHQPPAIGGVDYGKENRLCWSDRSALPFLRSSFVGSHQEAGDAPDVAHRSGAFVGPGDSD